MSPSFPTTPAPTAAPTREGKSFRSKRPPKPPGGETPMATFGLVFPGQGSQYSGMGLDLYRNDQSVRTLFADAGPVLGRDMASLCFEAAQELLDPPANTQSSVLTADLAAWQAFAGRVTAEPLGVAGRSVPCHSPLLTGAAERFGEALEPVDFRDCSVPVIPNCAPDLLHSRECTKNFWSARSSLRFAGARRLKGWLRWASRPSWRSVPKGPFPD